jgi:flagellum-specific ATP synthase
MALYADMADMIRLGAYRQGSDPTVDEAIELAPKIEDVLRQNRNEELGTGDSFAFLRTALCAQLPNQAHDA